MYFFFFLQCWGFFFNSSTFASFSWKLLSVQTVQKEVQSLPQTRFLGSEVVLSTVKFHTAVCPDDISLIHDLLSGFFSLAIKQQCVFDGVYDPASPPRSPFLHWITEFLPFTMPRPPAVHLICLSPDPERPDPEHTSVRNTGLQVHQVSKTHKCRLVTGGENCSLF